MPRRKRSSLGQPRNLKPYNETYRSLAEFVDYCQGDEYTNPHQDIWVYGGEEFYGDQDRNAYLLAREGWREGMRQATPIAKHALQTLEAESSKDSFEAEWGMAGSEVDVGRFLTGVPECMIEYSPVKVSNVGKVVTLVSSCSISASINPASVIKRGAAIVGLAMALEESQHSVEIWIDHTIDNYGRPFSARVLIKGAQDSIDPAILAYWLSNPSVLREMMFAHQYRATGDTGGIPCEPSREGMPEGTIYIGCVKSEVDIPDADRFVAKTLRDLGLTED